MLLAAGWIAILVIIGIVFFAFATTVILGKRRIPPQSPSGVMIPGEATGRHASCQQSLSTGSYLTSHAPAIQSEGMHLIKSLSASYIGTAPAQAAAPQQWKELSYPSLPQSPTRLRRQSPQTFAGMQSCSHTYLSAASAGEGTAANMHYHLG